MEWLGQIFFRPMISGPDLTIGAGEKGLPRPVGFRLYRELVRSVSLSIPTSRADSLGAIARAPLLHLPNSCAAALCYLWPASRYAKSYN